MSKKILSALLSFALLFSLCTVMLSADDSLVSPIMGKEFSKLKAEVSGFINSARGVIAKDDMTPRLWQTEKLDERYQQARKVLVTYQRAPETMENIIALENYLIGLYGGWDSEWNNGDGTFGAYIGGNLPFSPAQNAMCVRNYALDNYLARDPVYGYWKIVPVVGEVTGVHYIEETPEVIINYDGEDIVARPRVLKLEKDADGENVLVRQEGRDRGIFTNPGQYTHESWYNFAVKIDEMTRMMMVSPEYDGQAEIAQSFVTRSYMQNRLQEYRDAYDALELIPSETDPTLTDEQKAEARQKNRLQSILRMMLEAWPEEAVKKGYYANNLAHKFDYEEYFARQDGSTTQAKLDEMNQWYADHDLSYKITLSTDETLKNEARAWIAAAKAASTSSDVTIDELLQYVSIGERYADGTGSEHYVDDAEDPAKVRAEQITWADDYVVIRNGLLDNFSRNMMSGVSYRNAKNAIYYQAKADSDMQRYNSEEAKKAYEALIKSCETGDTLLGTTDRCVSETEFWDALQKVMTAYEALLPLRSNEPAYALIRNQIKAFMDDPANQPLYTPESWAALEAAVADFDAQREIYDATVTSAAGSAEEVAEVLASALEALNVKAYAMNEKYLTLEQIKVKVSNDSILDSARQIMKKAKMVFDFLDGSDMPYTADAFERFKAAYLALENAITVLEKERKDGVVNLTYGDKDLLSLIVNLITAQAGLVYTPDTCND